MSIYVGKTYEEVLPSIPGGTVQLVLADLPYNRTQNSWDHCVDLEWLWGQVGRLLTPTGVAIMFADGVFAARLMMISRAPSYKYKWIWEKSKAPNFLQAKQRPLHAFEEILVFGGGGIYNPQMLPGKGYNKGTRKDAPTGSYGAFKPTEVASEGERYPRDVVYFPTAESEGPVYHPTQKPLALLEMLIKTYTNPGDTVLDPCMGSGSAVVAAARTGRKYIGIEKETGFKGRALLSILSERMRGVAV